MGVLDLFLDLAAMPSPPGEERAVADRVTAELRGLGLEVDEDGAGAEIGSNAGNLYARLEPTAAGTPLFLCSHMDTVPPTGPIEPVVEDGVVRNAGGTILGADNKSAVVAMVETARRVVEERRPARRPRAPVHAEGGGRPARRPGVRLLAASPPGSATSTTRRGRSARSILGAPHSMIMEITFVGQSAHAGMAPEEGRSAIAAAGRAIADMRLGRLDEETSANVGVDPGRCRPQHRPRPLRPELRGALPRRGGSSRTSSRRCSTPARSPRP